MEPEELDVFIKICNSLGARGWCPGSSGNASIIIPEKGLLYIKEGGKAMASLSISDVVAIDINDATVKSRGNPSKEYRFHLGIYNARKDVKSVIHTHSPYATAFAIASKELPLVTIPGKVVLKRVPLINYAPAGSGNLARLVVECFNDKEVHAALLKDHGVVVVGETIVEAYYIAEWVEDAAREAFLSSLVKSFYTCSRS